MGLEKWAATRGLYLLRAVGCEGVLSALEGAMSSRIHGGVLISFSELSCPLAVGVVGTLAEASEAEKGSDTVGEHVVWAGDGMGWYIQVSGTGGT